MAQSDRAIVLYDSSGNPFEVQDGVAVPANTSALLHALKDGGGIARAALGDTSGRLETKVGSWFGATTPTVGQKAMAASLPVALASDQPAIPVTSTPASSTPGIAIGTVTTSAVTNVPVRATTYTEQAANFTGSIVSSSAADASAGTGARTVRIFWVSLDGTTSGSEDVTLNGTTAVNLVTTTKCFIERMEVLTVGSGGSNAGIISLKTGAAGAGTTVGTIAAGDNRTFWAHHYVISGKTCSVTNISGNNNNASNGSIITLRRLFFTTANAVDQQISDFIRVGGGTAHVTDTFGATIQVVGPARIVAWTAPEGTPSIINRTSFNFYDS